MTVYPHRSTDGTWGIWSKTELQRGSTVTVKAKSGKTWQAQIDSLKGAGHGGKGFVYRTIDAARAANLSPSVQAVRAQMREINHAHTSQHCDCGNWTGPGSRCLYN